MSFGRNFVSLDIPGIVQHIQPTDAVVLRENIDVATIAALKPVYAVVLFNVSPQQINAVPAHIHRFWITIETPISTIEALNRKKATVVVTNNSTDEQISKLENVTVLVNDFTTVDNLQKIFANKKIRRIALASGLPPTLSLEIDRLKSTVRLIMMVEDSGPASSAQSIDTIKLEPYNDPDSLTELRGRNSKSDKQKADLYKQNCDLNQDNELLVSQISALETGLKKLEQERQELTREVTRLKDENIGLSLGLDMFRSGSIADNEQTQEARDETRNFQAQLVAAQEDLRIQMVLNAQTESFAAQLSSNVGRLVAENTSLTELLDTANTHLQEERNRIELIKQSFERTTAELKQKLQKTEFNLRILEETNRGLKSELTSLVEQLTKTKAALQKKKPESAKLQAELTEKNDELKKAQQVATEQNKQIEALQTQLAEAEQQNLEKTNELTRVKKSAEETDLDQHFRIAALNLRLKALQEQSEKTNENEIALVLSQGISAPSRVEDLQGQSNEESDEDMAAFAINSFKSFSSPAVLFPPPSTEPAASSSATSQSKPKRTRSTSPAVLLPPPSTEPAASSSAPSQSKPKRGKWINNAHIKPPRKKRQADTNRKPKR